jgi:uncharacterized membrane protein YhaH (DUF805 family)
MLSFLDPTPGEPDNQSRSFDPDSGQTSEVYVGTPYTPYPETSGSPYGPGDPGQRGYLQGGPVGFGQAISEAFKNTFTYQGRASRSAYWWFFLFDVICYVVAGIFDRVGGPAVAVAVIIYVIMFFVNLSLAVRRLHDTDRSGFWIFIGLIPLIGGIVLLVFYLLPGTPGPNRHG